MICRCKYLLPCGYCDKYNIPCKAKKEDLANFYNIPLNTDTEKSDCEHDWQYVETNIGYPTYDLHRCVKCGETKKIEIEAL